MYQFFGKTTVKIALCCLVYLVVSVPLYLATRRFIHAMMAWNVLLAVLPLFFSVLLQKSVQSRKKGTAVLLAFFWLLFFPNAPYLVTDLIHLSTIDFYTPQSYTEDPLDWIRMLQIGFGVLLGTLCGLLSLYRVHRMLLGAKGKAAAGIALAAVCLLSGYGVYLGRFLRLNSWDILSPVSLAAKSARSFSPFSISFSLLMAGYVAASYCVFYVFFKRDHASGAPDGLPRAKFMEK